MDTSGTYDTQCRQVPELRDRVTADSDPTIRWPRYTMAALWLLDATGASDVWTAVLRPSAQPEPVD